MSLSPTYQNLSALSPLYFKDSDEKLEFINQDKFTLQGLNLVTYNINQSANDSFIKNYSVNNLIKDKSSSEIFNLTRKIDTQDLNTKLHFKSTQNLLSATFFLQVLTTEDDKETVATFNIDLENLNGSKFLVDFVNKDFCTVSFFDGKIPKFLYDASRDALIFKFLSTEKIPLTSFYYFNYFYDSENKKLRLYKDNNIVTTVTTVLTTNAKALSTGSDGYQFFVNTLLSAEIDSIGLLPSNEERLSNGTISVGNEIKLLNNDNIDQFTYYDFQDNYRLSNDTISGVKYDFLTYYTYSNVITGDKNYANLKFFNLKNHISNDNIAYGGPLENRDDNLEYRGREYQNFTNQKSKEKDFDNISLNYTFFDKEYKIGSKDYTAFTLPGDLFPFRKININDTGLATNGSFAATSPYFSDKVFKLTDTNKNKLQNSFIEDQEFLVLQNDVSLFVLQSGDLLGFQSINDTQSNDIFGDYLCTWLKGDGITKGVWFDRYYLPKENSYTVSFSGNSNIFNNTTQAAEFFKNNETDLVYYDLKSNMTFEPSASYGYQRINNKQINTYIDGQKDKLIKDSFNIQTSAVQMQDINEVNLNDTKGYDNLDIQAIPNRDFNIGFELELDSLSSLDSFQLAGNLYEDGFALKNNFFFTPFIFIPQGNVVHIYDNNLKLLRSNTYKDTENILDVLYIEQNNNIVLICDNRVIKTNYFGEILNERFPDDGFANSALLLEIIKSYKSKTYYGYNNVFFVSNQYITNDFLINFDLNNLIPLRSSILQQQYLSDPLSASYDSLVPTATGSYRFLNGVEPNKLNNNVACSLDNVNRFISKQLIPGEAFLTTSLSSELSGGIIQGQSYDENYYTVIQTATGEPTFNSSFLTYFDFIQDGRARIVFDNLNVVQNEDPILDSINAQIYDINSVNERLFVQYVNLTAGKGFVQEFTPERFKLSAYELSETVNTGYKIDFLEENKELKIMSFARDLSSNIVVDKINATTGQLEETYSLLLTGLDTTRRTIYAANQEIPVSTFGTNSLTALYPKGLYKYRRIENNAYEDIIAFNSGLSTKFVELSVNRPHFTPINYHAIDQKYSSYRDQLVFKFNLNSLIDVETITEKWNNAGPPLTATGYSAFTWSNPVSSLSAWDGEFIITSSEDLANVEIIFVVPNVSIKNYFNIDLDLNLGKIKLYNNGLFFGDISFNPNLIPIERIIYPELFINTQNIRNIPIDEIIKDISYNSSGGTLKNIKVHNTSFDQSLINYLELQTKQIDPLYFRVPCGTRNNNEEIDTLFTYKIPGNISNHIKVNIKDVDINNDIKQKLIDYLQRSVEVITPSQQKLIYNID